MRARSLEFVIPGDLQSATGGYGYDRRVIAGLRELGWRVAVHSLDGSFPFPTAGALEHAERVFAGFADHALVMVDGLALGAMPEVVARQAERLRLVGLVHHPLADETGLSRVAADRLEHSERASLRVVRHVIVTSEGTAGALARYEVEAARISVVVPGTDEAPPASGSGSDRAVQLLCVASLTPRKGHDLLIEALAALSSLPWKLTCVGRGRDEALREQIARASLEARITLAGELTGDALEAAYRGADLFVLATLYEGYGMVIAEALARGIPVVSTRTGAIPELVGQSGRGLDAAGGVRESGGTPKVAETSGTDGAFVGVPKAADVSGMRGAFVGAPKAVDVSGTRGAFAGVPKAVDVSGMRGAFVGVPQAADGPPMRAADAGLLVPPGDGAAFRDALASVLRDPVLFLSLRAGARAARDRLPRWPQSCAKMSQVLAGLIAS